MEGLLRAQNDILGRINRSFSNFKKEGTAKMTQGCCDARLENLTKYWNTFEKNHEILITHPDLDPKGVYVTENHYDVAEELFLTRKGEFLEFLHRLEDTNRSSNSKTGDKGPENGGNNAQPERQYFQRLEPIKIPEFSGQFSEWQHFRDMFKSLVIDIEGMPDVSKLHYLQTHLTGDAAELIESLSIVGASFNRAWEMLTKTYNNTRRLVNSHVSALFAVASMKSESSSELRRLLNGVRNPLLALEALERPTDEWDDLIVYLTVARLYPPTRKDWEMFLGHTDVPPTFEMLQGFLESSIITLEAIEASSKALSAAPQGQPRQNTQGQGNKQQRTQTKSAGVKAHHCAEKPSQAPRGKCVLCEQPHFVLRCEAFQSKTPEQRKEVVITKHLCYNCLAGHPVKECTSSKRCQICQGKHHTTLHRSTRQRSSSAGQASRETTASNAERKQDSPAAANASSSTAVHTTRTSSRGHDTVLLATAIVNIVTPTGESIQARALIDQCAQSSFVSESLCQRLRLKRRPVNVPVSGLGSKSQGICRGVVGFTVKPRFTSTFACFVDAYVIGKVSSYAPTANSSRTSWKHLQGLTLADPCFMDPGEIEVLLGAAVHAQIVESEVRKGGLHEPIATLTLLGWVLSGETNNEEPIAAVTVHHSTTELDLRDLLQRFWEQEELLSPALHLTDQEQDCEDHYVATHSRTESGRYIVRLPFKTGTDPSDLNFGDSYSPAIKMLLRMERRSQRDAAFQTAYCNFMREYEELGHMKPAAERGPELDLNRCFFLPHHGVIKEASTTTKFRTVFNGSFRTNIGMSLNKVLHAGQNLLPDLSDLILRWRKYRHAFAADIEKMFRQILVHEDDQHFQSIVWRYPDSPRVEDEYPLGARILQDEIYMDDVLSGDHRLDLALLKQKELMQLLMAGGFPLRKWLSNSPELLRSLPTKDLAVSETLLLDSSISVSVLGLSWQPSEDNFHFRIVIEPTTSHLTKREVLSRVAKLFDPLGWLAPVTVRAKIFLQSLWLLKIEWDEKLPLSENEQWLEWYSELPQLSELKIPRWIGFSPSTQVIELHGFADASMRAYAAVLYLRTITDQTTTVRLLNAKTKVAPLKTLSIPKLELCGAQLLARLAGHGLKNLQLENTSVHLWTDSMDVLYWLKGHPSRWQTFVANRCADIVTRVPEAHWHHVKSADNPADVASRGILPSQLQEHSLWWQGPLWLSDNLESWPPPTPLKELSSPKELRITAQVIAVDTPKVWDLLNRFSCLNKLLRVTVYCLRFLTKLAVGLSSRRVLETIEFSPLPEPEEGLRDSPFPAVPELEQARLFWVRLVQRK